MIILIAAVVAAVGLRYDVSASAGSGELSIEARIPAFPDREGELSVDDGAEPFVRDVAILFAAGTAPIERRGKAWFAPGCAARGCRSASSLGDLPYAAFGDLRVEKLRSEGGSPAVAIAKAPRRQSEEELLGWIRSATALIAATLDAFLLTVRSSWSCPPPESRKGEASRSAGRFSARSRLGTGRWERGCWKSGNAKMGSAPMKVDLDGLFLKLGVALRRGVVELDDRTPLAPIRRAITERR